MRTRINQVSAVVFFAAFAGSALAFDGAVFPGNPTGGGPPIRRTGNPADDNGLTCAACHQGRAVNSGPGRLLIRAANYVPGVKQTIEVDIRDADAIKWGFQLTARLASDPTRAAGTITPNDSVRVRCGVAGNVYSPCDGETEFASHTLASTEPGLRAGKTFRMEWTPPATDVGPVTFYASGNAANANNSSQGDTIYTTTLRISPAACSQTATPTIVSGGIVNAADYRTSIAANGLISIFGTNFAPSGTRRVLTENLLLENKVPGELDCLAVEIDGRRAPLYFADSGQINAQAPTTTTLGSVQVRVLVNAGRPNEIRSAPATVQMAVYSPALFTWNGTSVAATNAAGSQVLAETSVVAGGVAARPGDVVVLYGTGFGFSEPVFFAGDFSSARLRDPVTVTIGGTTLTAADVLFAGLSPSAPGLYQFNVRIPASAADGNVPVRIQIGGLSTQAGTTIPVRR